MADRKISALTALTSPATGDYLPIVDISEPADADKNKRITYQTLYENIPEVSPSADGLAIATSFSALTYASTTNLDMAALNGQYRTITLTGSLTFTTSNRANGRAVVLRLLPGASQRTLTFPSDWVFVSTKPANIAANKSAVLSLTFFGTADTDCIAAYSVQP